MTAAAHDIWTGQPRVGISGEIAEPLADTSKAFAAPVGGFADGAEQFADIVEANGQGPAKRPRSLRRLASIAAGSSENSADCD